MKKRITLTLSVILIAVSGVAHTAHAGIVDFFFPSLRDEAPDPSVTLQAPFIDQRLDESGQVEAENLSVPHRSTRDVSDWVLGLVSEMFTFQVGKFEKEQEFERQFFSESGWQKYQEFIESKNIKKYAQSGQYRVLSYASEMPLLLNSGEVGGRFRWLYEIPMTVSYLEADVNDYTNASAINQSYVVRVQVGRVPQAEAIDVMAIQLENWAEKTARGVQ